MNNEFTLLNKRPFRLSIGSVKTHEPFELANCTLIGAPNKSTTENVFANFIQI